MQQLRAFVAGYVGGWPARACKTGQVSEQITDSAGADDKILEQKNT